MEEEEANGNQWGLVSYLAMAAAVMHLSSAVRLLEGGR
jgi:hypothetical protein